MVLTSTSVMSSTKRCLGFKKQAFHEGKSQRKQLFGCKFQVNVVGLGPEGGWQNGGRGRVRGRGMSRYHAGQVKQLTVEIFRYVIILPFR